MAFVCQSLILFAQHSHLQLIVLSPTQLCSLWGNNTPFSFSVHLVMDTQADSTWGLLWTLVTTNTIMDVQVFLPHSDFDSFKGHPGMAQLDCLFSVFRGLSFPVSMVSGVISVSPAMDRGSSPFTVTGFSGCFPYDSRSDCRQDLCSSDLHLPDGRGCRGFFRVFIGHQYFSFWELSAEFICSLIDWIILLLVLLLSPSYILGSSPLLDE